MARYNIVAGSSDDISLDSNEWLIIDIGYARKSPTNAIWRSDETLGSVPFPFGTCPPRGGSMTSRFRATARRRREGQFPKIFGQPITSPY